MTKQRACMYIAAEAFENAGTGTGTGTKNLVESTDETKENTTMKLQEPSHQANNIELFCI